MVQKMRIGIMGGTFDPIHYGHLILAENALKQYRLDKVFFIPTGPSPHKNDTDISSAEHRCRMIQLAINENSGFELSRLEVDSNEVSYTYRTLLNLREIYPQAEIYFIMGGDSLDYLERWKNPNIILENAVILAAVRDEMDQTQIANKIAELKAIYGGYIYTLNTPSFSVSSNDIRKRVREDQSVRYLLPEEVRQYIINEDLYK